MSNPRIARKIPYKVEPTMWCSMPPGSNVHPTGRCTKFERHHTAKRHSEKTCENCLKGSLVIKTIDQDSDCINHFWAGTFDKKGNKYCANCGLNMTEKGLIDRLIISPQEDRCIDTV